MIQEYRLLYAYSIINARVGQDAIVDVGVSEPIAPIRTKGGSRSQ
jgi:hypothetical protein